MKGKENSVLIIGFNSRPIVKSLHKSGYDVCTVDFFGDLDLFPHVIDYKIIIKEINSDYECAKIVYHKLLAGLSIELLKKHENIKYIVIGSGLDDDIEERQKIVDYIEQNEYQAIYANNSNDTIMKARDIERIYDYLKENQIQVPLTQTLEDFLKDPKSFFFPVVLKRKQGSGGMSIYKIPNKTALHYRLKLLKTEDFNQNQWIIQQYIEGKPISCTTISNGIEAKVLTVNRQIIGEKFLNSPQEFMYCGNIVPCSLFPNQTVKIEKIAIDLCKKYSLMGINGFDFVLQNGNQPLLMEINPRIPGSLSASECVLGINLVDLHLRCFENGGWETVKKKLEKVKSSCFATKFIFFSPKSINKTIINKINGLDHVFDKPDPEMIVTKGSPICSVLFKGNNFSESYFGALKIIDKITRIIIE
ncbi:MAG: ATP-grasp domain-containing protein [Candidatus Lokiarchaeota archaeon]|nr:ATP-grasp domain-containing protein [Candidatus Lokiarchaeota archaeon]